MPVPTGNNTRRLRLRMHSPVQMDVYDSAGNHTGPGENPADPGDFTVIEEEIPNSNYFTFGETTHIGLDTEDTYTTKLTGIGEGTFTLEVETVEGNTTEKVETFAALPVLPGTLGEVKLNATDPANLNPVVTLDIDGNGTIDGTFKPSEEPDALFSLKVTKQIVQQADLPDRMKKRLTKNIEKLEKKLAKGETKKIPKILKKLDTLAVKKSRKNKLTTDEIAQFNEIIERIKRELDIIIE